VIQRSQQQESTEVEKVVEAYLSQRRMKLEKYVGILGTIGSNAPFVGLLGTVLGIIRAFHDMSRQGIGNGMEGITGGIAEALVATAVGLFVAVPAVVFFNLLTKRIGLLVQRAQSVSLLALSQNRKQPR
jgi:biopolymer transport protein ExbB/TolQ